MIHQKSNTEVQTALSTGKETIDDGEDITIAFKNSVKTFPVSILKQDEAGAFVAGAALEIQTKSDGKTVHAWTTEEDKTEKVNLAAGDYILQEAKAPSGYLAADDIAFTVGSDGAITRKSSTDDGTAEAVSSIIMIDQRDTVSVPIRKTDGKNALSGAKLQVINENDTVIDEWTTDGSEHTTNLPVGKSYTLHEKEAPKGYDYAEDIKIEVAEDGTVTVDGNTTDTVTMVDTPLAQLPNSGAMSDPWWLVGAAGCGLIIVDRIRRRKKEEQEKNKEHKEKQER